MKKLLVCMAVFLLLGASALAETVEIPLADGTLTFDPLTDGVCLTRESSASVFNRLGMSQREVVPWMEEHNLYALMYDAAWGCEVQIEVMEASQPDYNTITPEQDASMLESFVSFNEQYGLDVQDYGMYDNGHHRFGWLVGKETLDEGVQQYRIHYKTSHRDYLIEMMMFVNEATRLEYYVETARTLVDSMQYALREDITQLTCGNARIQCALPEGMTVHASAEEAGVTLPEAPYGEVVGCAAGEELFLLWQLDEKASGDMDRLSDAGVRALYQARAKSKKSAGCTVTRSADHPDGRQRYIITEYTFTDENGVTWYAAEYYTKQAGWGASVTAYSREPLTNDLLTMLQTVAESQMVSADE